MREFGYYRAISVPYPDHVAYERRLREEIDNTPMTAAARTAALSEVPRRRAEWLRKALIPYREEESRLQAEFWADCREDLGYSTMLSETGCEILETAAWNDGHSGGYAEVYNRLIDLSDLVRELVPHVKTP